MNSFLNDFKSFLLKLPKDQNGNFIDLLDEEVMNPQDNFLHQLCRKIDIKKSIYVAYDDQKDLVPVKEEFLSSNYWLKVIYVLSYFILNANALTIKYKAKNTLLKAKVIMPEECMKNIFVRQMYNKMMDE